MQGVQVSAGRHARPRVTWRARLRRAFGFGPLFALDAIVAALYALHEARETGT